MEPPPPPENEAARHPPSARFWTPDSPSCQAALPLGVELRQVLLKVKFNVRVADVLPRSQSKTLSCGRSNPERGVERVVTRPTAHFLRPRMGGDQDKPHSEAVAEHC